LPTCVVDAELHDPLAWYESERAALLPAVRQAADAGMEEASWDLAMTAVTLYETHSYYDDWRETHEVALAATRRARNARGQAAMCYSLGALHLNEGRFSAAADLLSHAMAMFESLGDEHGCGLALRNLAFIDRLRGDLDQGLARYKRSLVALRAAGDAIGEAHVLSNMAQISIEQHRDAEAEGLLAEALKISRRYRNRRVEAQVLHRLGDALARWGDFEHAQETYHNVVTMTRELGDLVGEAYALCGLGRTHLSGGNYPSADLMLGQAQRMAAQAGERLLWAQVQLGLGELCMATGRHDEGARHLTEAHEAFADIGVRASQTRARELLAQCEAAKR
jgi:tetratricopeptide (TPR) repeat protein